ncbi:hypothetical protein [Rhodoferax sp.]|uniref:hypothetical protein n=1 Tax=Rhodoferax sp. TaxID=50421 RepID=UPI00284AAA17|nr:hypothetical protein [Rhodoferax sp.]MDR3371304.1 hypothetical protein [Rhodoferax sp.]
MFRQIAVLLCHLVCVSALAAEPAAVAQQNTAQSSAVSETKAQRGKVVLGRDDPVYVVAHSAVDCPICKVWRKSSSGLPLGMKLSQTWPHVHFVLIDRASLRGSEDESLYPPELHFLYQERRDRYQLSPPTPLFEIVMHNRVVLRLAGLQAWNEQVIPSVQKLEGMRESASAAEAHPATQR